MLPVGFIARIIEYYTQPTTAHAAELDRALMTFFNLNVLEDLDPTVLSNPMAEGLLNEWLVFDYVRIDGRTFLQCWIEDNPAQLSTAALSDYVQLNQNQKYSFYEVCSIQLGHSLSLRDLFTDKTYVVREQRATYHTQLGAIFPTRLAQYRRDWYIVAADTMQWPIALAESMRQYLLEHPPSVVLSPKEIWHNFLQRNDTSNFLPSSTDNTDPKQVCAHLNQLLQQYELDTMVTVEQLQQWFYEEPEKSQTAWIPVLVCSLVEQQRRTEPNITQLIQELQTLSNISPRAIFDGASPHQRYLQQQATGQPYQPDIIMSALDIGGGQWINHHNQGFACMKLGEYRMAVQEYKRAFQWLYEHRATDREIYRLFSNAAVAHFACGQEAIGLAVLQCALELNPNYDFAQRLMEQFEAGTLPIPASKRRVAKNPKRDPLARHPAKTYMDWLRYLGINFKTIKQTQSPIQSFKAT